MLGACWEGGKTSKGAGSKAIGDKRKEYRPRGLSRPRRRRKAEEDKRRMRLI